MSATVSDQVMAKKKKISTRSQRIDQDILDKAEVVSSLRKIPTPDYLSDILRPVIEKDYQESIQKACDEIKKD